MTTDRACLRVDLSEADAALELLLERGLAASGPELYRIFAGVSAISASDPEWISKWFQGGALHVEPGPKLLELLAPMASVREALGHQPANGTMPHPPLIR
jgi:hypothetical protein